VKRVATEPAVVNAFKAAGNTYVSGEQLAATLGISRAAIWKAIKNLRDKGYEIEASTRLGYRMLSSPDTLIPEVVTPLLTTKTFGKRIEHFDFLASTNNEAKALAQKGAREGTVVIAEEQTGGKGRMDRSWVSPKGGVWMSIILRPPVAPVLAPRFAIMSAVAVAKSIKTIGVNPQIKWPNDILVDGKKMCGILLELAAQMDRIDHLVIGIGVNANFDAGVIAGGTVGNFTSLLTEIGIRIERAPFVADLLLKLEEEYEKMISGGWDRVKNDWLELCPSIGDEITLVTFNGEIGGKLAGIDDYGALRLQLLNGEIKSFAAGDVTVRKQ
jgi:BirA family biotin operon repressor/biotin-[acetyl-CoA-carboxylase] ligase